MAFFYVQLQYRAEQTFTLLGGLADTTGDVHYALGPVLRFLQTSGRGLPVVETDALFLDTYRPQCWVHQNDLIPYLRDLETERSYFLYVFFLFGRVREVRFNRYGPVCLRMCFDEGVVYERFLDTLVRDYGPYALKRPLSIVGLR